jgi:hypothetical protein
MEYFVAKCFQERNWPAQQGVYYKDPETGKEREIDVISHHVLERPRRYRGVGAPIINISAICECKSLSGHNLILLRGDTDQLLENRISDHWSGYEQHIRELVESIGQEPFYSKSNKQQLYSYYSNRAYPEGRAIVHQLRLQPPPVELNAIAFRETKGGQDRTKDVDNQGTASPLWSAIRSVLSAAEAAKQRSFETMRSYTSGRNPYAYDVLELTQLNAFFFDAELMRMACFHPVIFCKSRLFSLEQNEVHAVQSARLFIRNLDFNSRYVDIVNFDMAESYIERMISHFEETSLNAIRKTWDTLEGLSWSPGQASAQLAKAAGLMPKSKKRTSSKRDIARKSTRSP